MNNELKNEEVIEMTADEVVEEVNESKLKGFGSKVMAFGKKHGKKVAGVAAIVAASAIGYALGHKSGEGDSDYDDFLEEVDVTSSGDIVSDVSEE